MGAIILMRSGRYFVLLTTYATFRHEAISALGLRDMPHATAGGLA